MSDIPESGLLVFDQNIKLQYACAQGHRLISLAIRSKLPSKEGAVSEKVSDFTVPVEITELCVRLRRTLHQDTDNVPPQWQRINALGGFTFHAHWLNPNERALTALIAIVVRHHTPPRLACLPQQTRLHGLTSRQADVCARIAQGDSYKEIAKDLSLSVHTIIDHVRRIYEKLNVNSQSELVSRLLTP